MAGVACHHERVLAAGSRYRLAVIGGEGLSAPAGSLVSRGVGVEVRDSDGLPVRGTVVVFRVTRGALNGARVADSLVVTDDHGEAWGDLQMPSTPDSVEVFVFPGGAESRGVVVRARAGEGPTLSGLLPLAVTAGDTLSIAGTALGGVASTVEFASANATVRLAPTTGTAGLLRVAVPDCLTPGSVQVRVLAGTAWTSARPVQYTARRTPRAPALYQPLTITATELAGCISLSAEGNPQYLIVPQLATQGAEPPVSQLVRVASGLAVAAAAQVSLTPAPVAATDASAMQRRIDVSLREAERQLAPMGASIPRDTQPRETKGLTVGDRRTFQVLTALDGSGYAPATGQLRYLGRHLAIYVDTSAATSVSDPQLKQLGTMFDNDLYPAAVASFGAESDIDGDGHVLVFMTPRVNALVKAADCARQGFVTGFFFGRDLLPQATNSNGAELFYAMVPDSAAKYSCPHTMGETLSLVPGVFIHEFQHMISFFHHVLARGGATEEHWLNEGLSHIAEEIGSRIFEQRYPAPLGRSTTAQLFPDSSSPFISPQMLNAYVFLANSSTHSVTTFNGAGSIEERGAAWLFLRWLGDQKGDAIFQRLVQTSLTGIANVEARAGEPFGRLFGDFSAAIWLDSMPGLPRNSAPARYRFSSRNLRQLMAREAVRTGFPAPFPVTTVRLPFAGFAEGPMLPGTMVYLVTDPFALGTGPIQLEFVKSSRAPWVTSDGAQLGVIRVR